MSAVTAARPRVGHLTPKGQAAVALIRLRDGFDQLGEFNRRELAKALRELAAIYVPRGPRPAA